jgi:hypothetical protein
LDTQFENTIRRKPRLSQPRLGKLEIQDEFDPRDSYEDVIALNQDQHAKPRLKVREVY